MHLMAKGKEIAEHLDGIYTELLSTYDSKGNYRKILNLDQSIRFVGRIKGRKITSFVRRERTESLFDEEMRIWHTIWRQSKQVWRKFLTNI
jgi:hypothetical protein